MTKISFYILSPAESSAGEDAALRFACRLTEKAHGDGHRIYLRVPDASTAAQLDALLWTFRQGSFVPHAQADDLASDDLTPVVIGPAEPPEGQDDVMINLGGDVPAFFSRFERTLEVITPESKDAGRERYRFYKDRGYELETHNIG